MKTYQVICLSASSAFSAFSAVKAILAFSARRPLPESRRFAPIRAQSRSIAVTKGQKKSARSGGGAGTQACRLPKLSQIKVNKAKLTHKVYALVSSTQSRDERPEQFGFDAGPRMLKLCAVGQDQTESGPSMRIIGIIPARYASTRFPGKPLVSIAGKPLVQHVVERCRQAKDIAEVIIATDDAKIREVAQQFCRVEMTAADHPSGTDRIAEVAARCDCDAAINIQGDEPLLDPAVIDAVAGALAGAEMSTAATPIKKAEEYENPNVVKVVVSAAGRALYFSRRTIPYLRDAARPEDIRGQLAAFPFLKHLGIYGYRRETLLRLVRFPVSPLEAAEKLEQLRALENGIPIAVVKVEHDSVGVDVPADVARVERLLAAGSVK
jgi:3-deoxy-manno-octulosonate cytidylyltransferase (CMP-KDO synthetase)